MASANITHEELVAQAPQWNFAGDCKLLEYMKQISQHLERRATATAESLEGLNVYIKRTATALDNATNSLTALQYTQFVESRCQDDDDALISKAKQTAGPRQRNEDFQEANGGTKTTTEVLKTFLNNNIEMLRNSHQKYALNFDVPEGENEEPNCIYQPRNPYNERQLPHIVGSKLWKESWHVGLCDGVPKFTADNEDGFETVSVSGAEEGGSAGTPSQLTKWNSQNSVASNDRHRGTITHIDVQNASSLQGEGAVNAKIPKDPLPAGESDKKPLAYQNPPEADLFESLSNTTYGTSSSSAAATPPTRPTIGVGNTFLEYAHSSSLSSSSHTSAPMDIPKRAGPTPNNLFLNDEPPPLEEEVPPKPAPTAIVTQQQLQQQQQPQVKRKPVNLFDDEDFSSFMSEITEKVQSRGSGERAHTEVEAPKPAERKQTALPPKPFQRVIEVSAPSVAPRQAKETVKGEPPKEVTNKPPLNLFDSPEGSPTEEPLFAAPKQPEMKSVSAPPQTAVNEKTKISAKSLFDDDDEEDDFLNVFTAKKPSQIPSLGRTLLFDDAPEDLLPPKENKNVVSEINKQQKGFFDEDEEEDELFAGTKTKAIATPKRQSEGVTQSIPAAQPAQQKNPVSSGSLFNDSDEDLADDDLFGSKKKDKPAMKVTPSKSEVRGKPLEATFLPPRDQVEGQTDSLFRDEDAPVAKRNEGNEPNIAAKSKVDTELLRSTSESKSEQGERVGQAIEEPTMAEEPKEEAPREESSPMQEPESIETLEEHKRGEDSPLFQSIEEDTVMTSQDKESGSTKVPSESEENPVLDQEPEEQIEVRFDEPPPDEQQVELEQPTPDEPPMTNYNYSSIFLDEPPEDDDFFSSFSRAGVNESSSNSDNATKITMDAEHDFYEPPLPQLPSTSSGKAEIKEPHGSGADYGGLRLFSDVPPEDEGPGDLEGSAREGQPGLGESKRLHSVFYDDFSETIEAIKSPTSSQGTKAKLPIHSLFDDEPPEDDEDFDIIAKVMKGTSSKKALETGDERALMMEGQESTAATSPKAGVVETEQPAPAGQDFVDKVATSQAAKSLEDVVKAASPLPKGSGAKPTISKLPKININVQALLPQAGGGSPQFKKPATSKPPNVEEDKPSLPTTPQVLSEDSKSPTDNLLTNVTKHRVRGPAKRRPSTRQGRRESYRRSMEVQQDELAALEFQAEKMGETHEKQMAISQESDESPVKIEEEPMRPSPVEVASPGHAVKPVFMPSESDRATTSSSFFDEDEEDSEEFLFTSGPAKKLATSPTIEKATDVTRSDSKPEAEVKVPAAPAPPEHPILMAPQPSKEEPGPVVSRVTKDPAAMTDLFQDSTNEIEDDLFGDKANRTPSKEITPKPLRSEPKVAAQPLKKATLLFNDDEQSDTEGDGDLFSSPKAKKELRDESPKSAASLNVASAAGKKVNSLFGSDDDDEDNDDFLSALKKPQRKSSGKAAASAVAVKKGSSLFSESEDDDDDDLFGSSKSSQAGLAKPKPQAVVSPAAAKASITRATVTKTTPSDNPLADLL